MPNTLSTAQIVQFGNNYLHLAQQKMSRLRGAVMVESGVRGKRVSVDQLGTTAARRRVSRNGDTVLLDVPHFRRWINLYDYDWATLVDELDKLKTIADPTNPYAQQCAAAMGRAMDDEIINAAFATAITGEEAGGTEAWGTNVVAVNSWAYGTGSGNAGLTVSKVIEAKVLLDEGDTDPDEERYFACGGEQIGNLLATTEATSADYTNVKALAEGRIDTFCGFRFIRTQRLLQVSGQDFRRCIAWCKSGLALAIGAEPNADIGPRRDKNNATQIFSEMRIGATRTEIAKVVEVICDEV
jgi:hypothetical protein